MRTTTRNFGRAVACAVLCVGGVACERHDGGSAGPPALTAATLGEQAIMSNREYLELPRYAEAHIEYGHRLSMQCRACHTFERDGMHMIGPNLNGVFGRVAGSAAGFPYSRAMASAEFVWTPRALERVAGRSTEFLRGTSMAFAGIRRPDDRAALIASLLIQTADEPIR